MLRSNISRGLTALLYKSCYVISEFFITAEYGSYCVVLCRDKCVLVKVQGPRPENILFLIHEVYETMIMESFHGVTYDYYMPCQDCIKAVSQRNILSHNRVGPVVFYGFYGSYRCRHRHQN